VRVIPAGGRIADAITVDYVKFAATYISRNIFDQSRCRTTRPYRSAETEAERITDLHRIPRQLIFYAGGEKSTVIELHPDGVPRLIDRATYVLGK
jgi:hypothetical protein